MFYRTVTALSLLVLAACSADLPTITGCEPVDDMRPVCDMKTPEDIAALDDDRHLLLAHFGGMGTGTGTLSLFDTRTETHRQLFPLENGGADLGLVTEVWGDPSCTTPPGAQLSPHGTHLHQLADGRWRYLVVNHGGREAIELFELHSAGADTSIEWRGCVPAAPETLINDVVGMNNGDVIYSRMLANNGTVEMLKSVLGIATGELWRWSAEGGLRALPSTAAAQPNGLEISADNRFVFANMYMEGEVWKVDTRSGEIVARAAIASADNSAWGSDGRLLIATHTGSFGEVVSCFGNQALPCAAPFEIVALDTETMTSEVVFAHRGPPMGVATIAVPQAGRIYMGSFAGERMVSVTDFSRK